MIYISSDGIPFSESGLLQFIQRNEGLPTPVVLAWEFNEETDDWERPE